MTLTIMEGNKNQFSRYMENPQISGLSNVLLNNTW